MWQLTAVSFLWAVSPGLIKGRLGGLDGAFVAAARLGLALLVFAPWLRLRGLPARTLAALAALGAVQFGLMYVAYNEAFRFLRAHEVMLFTITTPLLVTLLSDALERRFHAGALGAAALAVGGAAVITFQAGSSPQRLAGFALMQLSNAAFAAGQVWYKRIRTGHPTLRDREVFGLLYAGAFVFSLLVFLARGAHAAPTAAQGWTLAYLGVISSGLGFFLWNVGATKVGAGTLAVMNNAKIPLGIACSLLFFGESPDLLRLLLGGSVMGLAVWLAGRGRAAGT